MTKRGKRNGEEGTGNASRDAMMVTKKIFMICGDPLSIQKMFYLCFMPLIYFAVFVT